MKTIQQIYIKNHDENSQSLKMASFFTLFFLYLNQLNEIKEKSLSNLSLTLEQW